MSAEIVELIIQAKDLASEAIIKLQAAMETLPQKEEAINAKLNQTRMQANEFVAKLTNDRVKLAEMERDKNLATLNDYHKRGLISEEQYSAGVKTVNSKMMADMAEPSHFQKIKDNWLVMIGAIIAAWAAVSKAVDYAKLGAAALQTEESFKNVTASYGVEGDKLLAKMQEVSAGVIDQTDLMQRATKALQQGLSAEQIVNLLEVARSSARIAGTDIVSAFDGITNAVANQTTRALKLYGIVIDQNKAMEDYAKKLGISKDALNEQMQSQALATATIEEGNRQMQAMGNITLNASEKIQMANAQLHELKETIGKGVLNAIQGLGGTLYWLASGAMVAAAAIMIVNAACAYANLHFEEAKKLSKDASAMFDAAGEVAAKSVALWDGISMATAEAAEASKGLAKQQQTTADGAVIAAAKQKDAAEIAIAAKKAQVTAFEADMNYEIALERQRYSQGKISLDEYLDFVKTRQEEHVRQMIALKEMELAAIKEDPKITETERAKKVAEIEAEIVVIKKNSAAEQLKTQQALTEGLRKEHQTDFDNWKSLQELKLQSLQSTLDLQNTIEENAVKQGLMRQSSLLESQLDRFKQAYDARVRKVEETMARIAELESQDLTKDERDKLQEEYRQAYEERENLQRELEGTIIQSEYNIAEARKQEELEASKFIAGLTGDRAELTVLENQQRLDELEKFHKLALISEEQYHDALIAIEQDITSKFKLELQERTEQLNRAIEIVNERRQRLEEAVSGMMTESWGDVQKYFGDWKDAINTTVDEVQFQINHFMDQTIMKGYETFWSAQLFGRRLIEMTGTTVYEWAQRVTDYINYIKSLVQSLEQYIISLRMQLAQLRGDRLAELEMWYAQEKEKIEDQYKDLEDTQEYYDALALLLEIYAEKKKKILEQMAEDEEEYSKESESGGGAGGGGGGTGGVGGGIIMPSMEPYFQNIKNNITEGIQSSMQQISSIIGEDLSGLIPREMTVKKDVTIRAELDVTSADDNEYINRLFENKLWPLFKKKLELIGVEL